MLSYAGLCLLQRGAGRPVEGLRPGGEEEEQAAGQHHRQDHHGHLDSTEGIPGTHCQVDSYILYWTVQKGYPVLTVR